jgi:hypothetical protein
MYKTLQPVLQQELADIEKPVYIKKKELLHRRRALILPYKAVRK